MIHLKLGLVRKKILALFFKFAYKLREISCLIMLKKFVFKNLRACRSLVLRSEFTSSWEHVQLYITALQRISASRSADCTAQKRAMIRFCNCCIQENLLDRIPSHGNSMTKSNYYLWMKSDLNGKRKLCRVTKNLASEKNIERRIFSDENSMTRSDYYLQMNCGRGRRMLYSEGSFCEDAFGFRLVQCDLVWLLLDCAEQILTKITRTYDGIEVAPAFSVCFNDKSTSKDTFYFVLGSQLENSELLYCE